MHVLREWIGSVALVVAFGIAGCGLSHVDRLGGDGATDGHLDAEGDRSQDVNGLDADAASCPVGMVRCGGACVLVSNDHENCGGCGHPCLASQVCDNGICTMQCSGTTPTLCGSTCVDLTSDTFHCGGCTTACSGAQTCVAGACTCPSGETPCSGLCVNEQTDGNHCGSCTTVCAGTTMCTGGHCATTCGPGQTVCGTSCVNELTDPQHCGGCGTVCAPMNVMGSPLCTAGACDYVMCAPGFSDCDGNRANGCEMPTRTDVNNCGGCGTRCTATTGTHSSAVCSDSSCGIVCTGTHYANCNGLAADGCEVDTHTDANNCSACGTVCPSGANSTPHCGGGTCGIACIAPNFRDCDTMAANGCEVDTSNDVNNCGACGTVCNSPHAGNNVCLVGVCSYTSCAPGYADCSVSSPGCETPLGTSTNCSRCNEMCTSSETCNMTTGCH